MINLLLIILLFYGNGVNKTTVEEEVINIGGQSMEAPHRLEAARKIIQGITNIVSLKMIYV